ncbi:hypothetical protein SPI_01644 [Niveomyces insectorum RCEF 264]|uniref:YMC020W-like alpha/beta hydrolase domain-containing protein n=1 Tax=Niveomyces insectorum RCEF 264 TaxID=1081102 RepID=A0A167Z4C3_9HYPO|nr:hypothetical protein SPI_01644 [Niveomyces insectorum RCEF 264]
MAKSPASSATPSVAESTGSAKRYASLKESKNKTRSWYGSWPRVPKSAASTLVSEETILGGTSKPSATPDFGRFDTRKPGEAASSSSVDSNDSPLSKQVQARALANDTEAGEETGSARHESKQSADSPRASQMETQPDIGSLNNQETTVPATEASTTTGTDEMDLSHSGGTPLNTASAPPAPGWFSWLARKEAAGAKHPETEPKVVEAEVAPPLVEEAQTQAPPIEQESIRPVNTPVSPVAERPATSGGVWSYLWSGSSRASAAATEGTASTVQADAGNAQSAPKPQSDDITMEDAPSAPIPVPAGSSASKTSGTTGVSAPANASAGSTWAFWSRDAKRATGKSPTLSEGGQGEIAVMGDRSEHHPKPATEPTPRGPSSAASSVKDITVKESPSKDAKGALAKKAKRLRPQSMEIDDVARPATPTAPPAEVQTPTTKSEPPLSSKQASSAKAQPALLKTPPPPNLLLPSFRSTYRLKENPSILRQITQLLLRTQQAPANHLFLAKDPPKIKKAVAIGVHGLFPAAYLRAMIGQPTGTSIRFANHGAEAVRRWADSHGCPDCEIEKIALEGEGKIADRVENLWKLLLNWVDHIRNADLVVLACHSQGVPVGIMLLAKLIDMGIVTTARVGVCAMAGVSLGPFPDYKSGLGILMGSATELWDFANPESEISKRYAYALKAVLEHGVRITFVGSIDDQVVPLESAIYSPVHHPYVYRAVFVDGRIHAPDFIAHLVGFACKLRNMGVSDHGLVRELSVPLAGSLYSGEGHSRLYDDPQVYDLAVSHALETADIDKAVCEIRKPEGLANPNPYHLPWVMRGLLEEDFVKTELHTETAELVRQFDDWKPVTKALKDVKYRLEAVRSKL